MPVRNQFNGGDFFSLYFVLCHVNYPFWAFLKWLREIDFLGEVNRPPFSVFPFPLPLFFPFYSILTPCIPSLQFQLYLLITSKSLNNVVRVVNTLKLRSSTSSLQTLLEALVVKERGFQLKLSKCLMSTSVLQKGNKGAPTLQKEKQT